MWHILQSLEQNRTKAALCIIVEAKGSTPRKAGAKMIVTENNQFFGTIGGGDLEFFIIEKARQLIAAANPKPQLISVNLASDVKMACGGNVKIYIEPIIPKNQLIIFGAGHVGKALAFFAQKLDFNIILIDPRKNIFPAENFDKNVKFVNDTFENAINNIKFDYNTFICSLAFTHDLDLKIAKLCLNKPFAYFGIIASKNKANKIRSALQQDGFKKDLIDKLDMPMGVPIANETPEEIAISILAKIIDVKNSLNNGPTSSRQQISLQTFRPESNSNQKNN